MVGNVVQARTKLGNHSTISCPYFQFTSFAEQARFCLLVTVLISTLDSVLTTNSQTTSKALQQKMVL